jgi:hypothetical protein
LPDPYCEASILSDSQGSLFLANPSHPGRRLNFSVHRSFDGGRSWPTSVVVYAGDAGYSDMAFVRNGSLAVFFEKDFAVNSVAFGVVPLPPLKPLIPLKPPYRASEVGGERWSPWWSCRPSASLAASRGGTPVARSAPAVACVGELTKIL